MPAFDPQEDLEQLKAKIAFFCESEAQAQATEGELRAQRNLRVAAVCDLDAEQARELHAGPWKEGHRLLVHSGLRDLPREPAEEARAAALRRVLGERVERAPGALLAAMLLLPAFELPLPPDLDGVPGWLLPEYGRFLLAPPRIFHQPGDAERYAFFLRRAVALFHRYVMRRPSSPLAAEMREVFVYTSHFMQLYFNEQNLKDVYRQRAEILESWILDKGGALAHLFPSRSEPRGARRIRVGVLCDQYYAHTEIYFMLAHLERLPRERCTLILYAVGERGHHLDPYARSLADAAVTLPRHEGEAVARVRADDLDVLIFGSNVTVGTSRWALHACFRLARVQVISGSSPVTSGMTSADWYLSAEDNETEEGAATQFTERVYRMPGMGTRYAYYLDKEPATSSISRSELGIPDADMVFFSAANFFKVIPDLSAQWARVMAEFPAAWLVLMPFNQNWSVNYLTEPFTARILEQINALGGDASRVLILAPVPTRADLHRVMALADVYLDSFPFPGACSLLDPLLLGMPVVARAGRTFRGNVAAGMLRGLGLGDMLMADADAYVTRAVALGRDPALRAQARDRIKAALVPINPVFDSETASRNFEAAIVDIVSRTEAEEAALLRQPAGTLRSAIERVAGELAISGNRWFAGLTGPELIRLLLVPYFRSMAMTGEVAHMIDVGASGGQAAESFVAMGWNVQLLEPEPSSRLDRFTRQHGIKRVDMLKIDAAGRDFEVLRSHDFGALPPRLAMVEFSTGFAQQSLETVDEAIAEMGRDGYEALVFSYEPHGNFNGQAMERELIAADFAAPVPRGDGDAGGNIVFFGQGDTLFLATVLRLFLSFLPPRERQAYV
jgi:predicted O-linked N-acetylglucosamine transferase (SPINDLY family)